MTAPILTLRVSRRAVGAVVLADEAVTFRDGRYLRSNRESALTGLSRYVQMLLALTKPTTVVVDCPHHPGSSTERLFIALGDLLRNHGMMVRSVTTGDLLSAFGVTGLDSRLELRRIAEPLFSELSTFEGKVKPYVIDAAASALYAESHAALGESPP